MCFTCDAIVLPLCCSMVTCTAWALQVVGRGLQDPEAKVRGQAAFALGQLAEYCQPDINEHYRELLPGVFHVMHDPTPEVQQQACYALDAFCENLGKAPAMIPTQRFSSRPAVHWMSVENKVRNVPGGKHQTCATYE